MIVGFLMVSFVVQSQNIQAEDVCANGGGKIIIGHNGTIYCQSNRGMNWWTALEWCQEQGKELIRYPVDCKCVEEGCPVTACSNLTNIGQGQTWTATPWGNGYAYYISLISGHINGNGRDVKLTSNLHAVCK